MASTIVLALVDAMGVKIWRKNFLVPREFCLWGDLSAAGLLENFPSCFVTVSDYDWYINFAFRWKT